MKQQDFEQLIQQAGLNLLSNYTYRFVVSLYVPTELVLENGSIVRSLRIQCDLLAYEPAELAMMTPERATYQIEMCKAQLAHAATTQQGRLADERAPQTRQPVQKVVAQQTAINYPAH